MKIQCNKLDITVFESCLYRTTSTVIGFDSSVIIIDPNWLPIEIATIKHFVDNNHFGKEQFILFTHSDYDHIIGYGSFNEAKVIASESFVNNRSKTSIIKQIEEFDNEYYINRPYPITYPIVDIVITHSGQKIIIDKHELIFFLAPGHNVDGVFTLIPNKKCWIAGDYLSNIEIPFIDFDIYEYEKTLATAFTIHSDFPDINLLIPGHGDIADSNQGIKNRIENDLKYLDFVKKYSAENSTALAPEILNHINLYSKNPVMLTAHQKNIVNSKLK